MRRGDKSYTKETTASINPFPFKEIKRTKKLFKKYVL
jgi:hypothetical protein